MALKLTASGGVGEGALRHCWKKFHALSGGRPSREGREKKVLGGLRGGGLEGSGGWGQAWGRERGGGGGKDHFPPSTILPLGEKISVWAPSQEGRGKGGLAVCVGWCVCVGGGQGIRRGRQTCVGGRMGVAEGTTLRHLCSFCWEKKIRGGGGRGKNLAALLLGFFPYKPGGGCEGLPTPERRVQENGGKEEGVGKKRRRMKRGKGIGGCMCVCVHSVSVRARTGL